MQYMMVVSVYVLINFGKINIILLTGNLLGLVNYNYFFHIKPNMSISFYFL